MKDSVVCGLSRAREADIDHAGQALKGAAQSRIHTFIATSPIHMKMKLRLQPDEVIEHAVKAVKYAGKYTNNIEFSPEDAGRSDPEFLCRVLEAVINAGATTVNIPDTVGYAMPTQFGELIKYLIENTPNSDKAIFSVHCHNDLGLAVANSLAAVSNGARQVECTINGLGERAGNAALEEVVMGLRTRQDYFECDSEIDTTQILSTSRLVSGITGFAVQPNKAIVGANAFAHESGIHQDGVLKSRETYEIMRPEDVGWHTNRMILGKHSGRNAFKTRLVELGIAIGSDAELNNAFTRFKDLADKKHEIYDEDLQALVSQTKTAETFDKLRLVYARVCSETGETPTARVTLAVDGVEVKGVAEGSGPVDAVFKAIETIIPSHTELLLYSVNNITTGTDSQGEVTVRLERGGRVVNGKGADTDIVIASARSYVNALNKILHGDERLNPQQNANV